MTKEQIIALREVVDHLYDSTPPESLEASLSVCNDLLLAAEAAYVSFDASRGDLVSFMKKWDITIPLKEFSSWRMCLAEDQLYGEINALPESRGILRATNGILCYIETPRGLYLGHIGHWQPDEKQPEHIKVKAARPASQRPAKKSALSKLMENLVV